MKWHALFGWCEGSKGVKKEKNRKESEKRGK